MKFVNHATYCEDQDKVSALRPEHRKYASDLMTGGKLVAAGPFTDGSGALFIYEAASLEEAQDLFANDPFTIGGAIVRHDIRPWRVLGVNPNLFVPD